MVDCGGQGNEGRGLKWSINGGATPSLTPTHTANTDQQNKMRLSVNCGRISQNAPTNFHKSFELKLIYEGTLKKMPLRILCALYHVLFPDVIQYEDGQYYMVILCSRERTFAALVDICHGNICYVDIWVGNICCDDICHVEAHYVHEVALKQ